MEDNPTSELTNHQIDRLIDFKLKKLEIEYDQVVHSEGKKNKDLSEMFQPTEEAQLSDDENKAAEYVALTNQDGLSDEEDRDLLEEDEELCVPTFVKEKSKPVSPLSSPTKVTVQKIMGTFQLKSSAKPAWADAVSDEDLVKLIARYSKN